MSAHPKACRRLAPFHGVTSAGASDHGNASRQGLATVKPRFNPVEWTVWFRAMRALKRFCCVSALSRTPE